MEKKRTDKIKNCECGFNLWKTKIKGKEWECHNCKKIRKGR